MDNSNNNNNVINDVIHMLAVPQANDHGRSLSVHEQHRNPYISKLGGRPVWLSDEAAGDAHHIMSRLSCRSCKQSKDIIFLAQIYAPVDDIDRALYVFACNRRQCSSSTDGWIVLRDQRKVVVADHHHHNSSNYSNTAIKKTDDDIDIDKIKKPSSQWDFLSDSNTTTATNINNNNNNNNNNNDNDNNDNNNNNSDDDSMDDLYELLAARDNSLKQTSTSDKPLAKRSDNNGNSGSGDSYDNNDVLPVYLTVTNTVGVELPCIALDEVEDPDVDHHLCDNSDDDDDDDDDDDNIFSAITAISDSKVQALLESYICDEDDLEIEVLNQHNEMKKKNKKNSTTSHHSGTDFSSKVLNKDTATNDAKNIDSDGGGGALEKKLSGKDKKRMTELHFQKKLSYEPRQVLRYAYEGEPLWYTAPPSKLSIPVCSNCGASRVFEVQLMPTILSYIKINNSSMGSRQQKESDVNDVSASLSTIDELLGNGLEFGVVCIYSCPSSCSHHHHSLNNICEEHVVVQSQE